MTNEENKKSKLSEREEKILDFWNENKIFEKSLLKDSPKGDFVFYDGPPFATGLPHYGHILAGTIKDVILRYKTMSGFHVERRWGWDCHGLPIENIIEKELGLTTKKDVENFGIDKFNEKARGEVMRFANDWRKIVPRLGRFVDMVNDYKTMDSGYTESVWWVFKTLYEKNLIYEGFKSMHLCPRCETTLSNFEVNQGYKDVTDLSVYVKFEIEGEPKTFLLAWTTTPWTLPGNVALAVNSNIEYVLIENEGEKYLIAKSRYEKVFSGRNFSQEKTIKGSELVGKKYKPLFDYYAKDEKLENRENGWKIYDGDFVTTEDGTGVVHIAPAFGEDDLNLGKKMKLPFVQHVGTNGKFLSRVTDFASMSVKPKSDDEKARFGTDIAIIKYLQDRGSFFAKEKINHSYPHCWRCETPLLNFASSSWFVKVTNFKDSLIRENKKVKWVPGEIGEGRFGNWLSGARDWAISRSRFWGAPLPVWRCEGCKKEKVVCSIEEISSNLKPRNRYFVMRHGEAENNVLNIISSDSNNPHHLTEKGRNQVMSAGSKFKNIDLIFSSPFLRTKETAEIVKKESGFSGDVIFDERLYEVKSGEFNNKKIEEYHAYFKGVDEYFTKAPPQGETYLDIRDRLLNFISEIDKKYKDKKILIITHNTPAWILDMVIRGVSNKDLISKKIPGNVFLKNAEVKEINYVPLPRNKENEIDFHRPYIDQVEFECECHGKMKRVSEVFDCWFESGSMPYGEANYPKNKDGKFNPVSRWFKKSKGFPADFIAEGLDQTRGWFYSMMVLGVGLFGKTPYKNVIVNGLVLAEDGRKMSKSLKNFPDPMNIVDQFGADPLRFYLLSSPAVRSEDLKFSQKGVDDVSKKIFLRLDNVLAFYKLFKKNEEKFEKGAELKNVLDKWIVSRGNELVAEVTKSLELYEIDKALRPVSDFVDDLSTWYLRRSRDRFKGEDREDSYSALFYTRYTLILISKILAPFSPFFADYLYRELEGEKESVHLEDWPIQKNRQSVNSDQSVLRDMKEVRRIVSLALEVRAKANVKVRQPLRKLEVGNGAFKLGSDFVDLVKDEVNVKEVYFNDTNSNEVILDLEITPELKKEGEYREILRRIQELRKEKGLNPGEMITLKISAKTSDLGIVNEYENEIKKLASISKIEVDRNQEQDLVLV